MGEVEQVLWSAFFMHTCAVVARVMRAVGQAAAVRQAALVSSTYSAGGWSVRCGCSGRFFDYKLVYLRCVLFLGDVEGIGGGAKLLTYASRRYGLAGDKAEHEGAKWG